MDDWGFGHAGAYGCGWVQTPAFDRIAARGVTFNNTFTWNPKCAPCRASILTGRNAWQLKEAVTHYSIFPRDFAIFPDLLKKAGHLVGLAGKSWGPGDFKSPGWPRNPAAPLLNRVTTKPPGQYIGNNAAKDPQYAEIKRKMRERMEEMLRGAGDPRLLNRADFFDTIEYTGPRRHSYEKWLKNNGARQ